MRRATADDVTRIWLVDQNPFDLPEPPRWWQTLVFDYDKMLRVMPSQRDQAYRLCRVVRRDARLGLNAVVVHEHPDTVACIKFGVVPILTLLPHAVYSTHVIEVLRARDTWTLYGGDPHKLVDALEAQEHQAEAAREAERHAQLDEINTSLYRAIRYGRPEMFDLGNRPAPRRPAPARPLPQLQNRDPVLDSALPAGGTPSPAPTTLITKS